MSMALMLPQMHVASHNPLAAVDADIERHLELKSEAPEHSAHTHDNGTQEEANLNHQHGHNSADHTHHTVFLSTHDIAVGSKLSILPPAYIRSHVSPAPFLWQRPPKRIQVS
ncbi:MAG: hypothetical protein V7752_06585 [Halopseudomonas sp.]